MKAAVITRYGSPDVVKILDVPKPTPAAGEILIRVHAATVNRTDCGELRAHPFFSRFFFGLRRPNRTIFGLDFAGEVEAVGAGTLAYHPGDRVFGMCPSRRNGAHAEYVCVPERTVAAMPAGARFDQAVVCEGAFYAKSALNRIDLKPGKKILIYGASGAIGTAMVQLGHGSRRDSASGSCQIPRCGPRRRLHLRGFHGYRRDLRFRGGCGGKNVIFPLPQAAEARRGLCCDGSRTVVAERRARAVVIDDTAQSCRHCDAGAHQRICRLLERPHGSGPISSDHRSNLPSRGNCGRVPLCRDRPKGWHRGH